MQYIARQFSTQSIAYADERAASIAHLELLRNRIENLLPIVREISSLANTGYDSGLSSPVSADRLYSARRTVDQNFELEGFSSSPAWDIMLDLLRNEELGRKVSVTSACIGAACPSTTALRWLQALVGMSLIEKQGDPNDKRRSFVMLTSKGRELTQRSLEAYFQR